jgi:hypothetical protein
VTRGARSLKFQRLRHARKCPEMSENTKIRGASIAVPQNAPPCPVLKKRLNCDLEPQ